MSFCGQCGNLLAPNAKKCPRCGAVVDDKAATVQVQPETPSSEEDDYATQLSVDSRETAWMANSDQGVQGKTGSVDREQTIPPSGLAGSFSSPSYHTPAESHPGSNDPAFAHGGATYPDATPSPEYPMTYPEAAYHTPVPAKKSSTALTLSIIAFVFAAALTITLFLMKPGTLGQFFGHTATPTVATAITPTPSPTATRTPEQQAQAVIEQYFNYINQKNYQAAYNLWSPPPSSYQSFVSGFTHTQHDDIQTGSITQQSDGTIQVPIVITALTDKNTKDTFSGYYVVGQQPDGSWKITGAKINPGASS